MIELRVQKEGTTQISFKYRKLDKRNVLEETDDGKEEQSEGNLEARETGKRMFSTPKE